MNNTATKEETPSVTIDALFTEVERKTQSHNIMAYRQAVSEMFRLPRNKWKVDRVKQTATASVGALTATTDQTPDPDLKPARRRGRKPAKKTASIFDQTPEEKQKALTNKIILLDGPSRKFLIFLLQIIACMDYGPQQLKLIETEEEERDRRTIRFPVDEYHLLQKEKSESRDKARIEIANMTTKIKNCADAIYRTSFNWSGKNPFNEMRILSSKAEVEGKEVSVVINKEFMTYVKDKTLFMYVPRELYRIDDRHQIAISLCLKMAQHFSMDSNREANRRRVEAMKAKALKERRAFTDEDFDREIRTEFLSVEKLLAATELPKAEEVKNWNYSDAIVKPFLNALEVLTEPSNQYLAEYTFWRSREEPATDKDLKEMKYRTLKNLFVKYTVMNDIPDQTDRLARREQQRQRRLSRKAKNRGSKRANG